MTLVILTAQISHYHDARFRAVAATDEKFVVLSTQNEGDFAEFIVQSRGHYLTELLFTSRKAYLRAVADWSLWPAIQHKLDALNPTVIAVAGWATPESLAAMAWARANRRRLVVLSESQERDAPRANWREWIKARVVGLCDAALVGGPSHLQYVTNLGISLGCAFEGYDAVDNGYFARGAQAARADEKETRARLGLPQRYILASARFIPRKNLPRLIAAYARALECQRNAPDLLVLGDGPDRVRVEATIDALGIGNRVNLRGFKGYNDLPAFYGLSNGFVHVPTSEQWGLVINEAAASGVPVVASSVCGATATLVENGVTGFVVDAMSDKSIFGALVQLVELDTLTRRRMGGAGERRVASWGTERFASGLLCACAAARSLPARGLFPWDEALLKYLAWRTSADMQQQSAF